MERLYTAIIEQHLAKYRQMTFIAGPRQVGKTTCSKMIAATYPNAHYLNWDHLSQRKLMMQGPEAVASHCGLEKLSDEKSLVVFDEIHKYRHWKQLLKGYFDVYEAQSNVIVTGSTKLNVYRRGGDSLMGRYFLYRMHPLSVGELLSHSLRKPEIVSPAQLTESKFKRLMTYGGFPEPYSKADPHFSSNWHRLRKEQLLREDIRELSQVHDLSSLEYLLDILVEEAGQQMNVSIIASQLNVAQSTIHRWVSTLQSFYYCFTIKPWFKNLRRSIRKMPKVYLWDWSLVKDKGRLCENFVASHLLKAVHYWTDSGFGEYDLHYLRDKEKREVDFLVTKNKKPWFLVEVKHADTRLSENLAYYHDTLKTEHAFQVVFDMDYVNADCFKQHHPLLVPASTFLSQLV